jgi:4-diphosphocytidyl-2-C-methyl-D-erythritol kinase
MIHALAYAKVNFGLRVGRLRDDGYHPIDSIFQSVAIADRLTVDTAEEDAVVGVGGRPVADGFGNLVFRAVKAVRDRAESQQPLHVSLDKAIPAAAGLGGGSADAAAGLAAAGRYFGMSRETLDGLAPELGSDVPFCLVGGTARVTGRGDVVTAMDGLDGFSLAIVVPPVEISTPAAFHRWDELGDPEGLAIPQRALPPQLRDEGDLRNDLYPAAVALAPELDDWRAELEERWSRPVLLSGSGASLFGFFLDSDEAAAAANSVPVGARFAEACDLVSVGWRLTTEP